MDLLGIIFDLDGTVGDTVPICISSVRAVLLDKTGQNHSDDEITAMFGPSEEGIIRKAVGEGWEEAVEMLYREYERNHSSCNAPFPGFLDLLSGLKSRGIMVGIVTGKGARTMAISLRHMGLEDAFDTALSGSPEGAVKPELIREVAERWGISPDKIAYVGDMVSDFESAREAEVVPIGAAWAESTDIEGLLADKSAQTFTSIESFIEWLELTAS